MRTQDNEHMAECIDYAMRSLVALRKHGDCRQVALWVRPTRPEQSGTMAIAVDNPNVERWEHVASVPPATDNQLRNWLREHARRLPILPIE